jgi:hypothetical protein
VATLKHRVAKSQANNSTSPLSLRFSTLSQRLHKQQELFNDPESFLHAGHQGANGRWQAPDIFEVVDREESAVPQLAFFQRWLHQQSDGNRGAERNETENMATRTIVDLYRDEHAWQTWSHVEEAAVDEEARNAETFWLARRPSQNLEDTNLQSVLVGEKKARWMSMW